VKELYERTREDICESEAKEEGIEPTKRHQAKLIEERFRKLPKEEGIDPPMKKLL
jgi:hypothetical protein